MRRTVSGRGPVRAMRLLNRRPRSVAARCASQARASGSSDSTVALGKARATSSDTSPMPAACSTNENLPGARPVAVSSADICDATAAHTSTKCASSEPDTSAAPSPPPADASPPLLPSCHPPSGSAPSIAPPSSSSASPSRHAALANARWRPLPPTAPPPGAASRCNQRRAAQPGAASRRSATDHGGSSRRRAGAASSPTCHPSASAVRTTAGSGRDRYMRKRRARVCARTPSSSSACSDTPSWCPDVAAAVSAAHACASTRANTDTLPPAPATACSATAACGRLPAAAAPSNKLKYCA